jgi:hypothetical protein
MKTKTNIKLLKKYIKTAIKISNIYEGKAAAVRLLPKFGIDDLKYSELTDEDMQNILPAQYGQFPDEADTSTIGNLLYKLGELGLIDKNVAPKLKLGSTRMAAVKKYKSKELLTPAEKPDIVSKAGEIKKTYGDIDIDVSFLTTAKKIANVINSFNPTMFQTLVTSEIHIALRSGKKVFQVDLVDVQDEKRPAEEFLQSSSFIDLSQGVKGVFQTEILRAIVNKKKPDLTLQYFTKWVKANPTTDFAIQWDKLLQCDYMAANVRYSLTKKGLQIVVDFTKPSKIEGKTTRKGLKCPIKPLATFNNLDELAQVILGNQNANGDTIYSAIKLSQFINDVFPQNELDIIWNDIISRAETGSLARLDKQHLDIGMKAIASIFNKSWLN